MTALVRLDRRDDSKYQWDRKSRRFRDPSGKYVSQTRIKSIKNKIVDAEKKNAATLASRAVDGSMSPELFVRTMRALLRQTTLMEYMLGRGGLNAMTNSDNGRVGSMLRRQYQYLNRFAADIEAGLLTVEQAQRRAEMYIETARNSYERGQAASWDIRLPEYPPRHVNCACSWAISAHGSGKDREIRAYWRVNSANVCDECKSLQETHAPYRIPSPE